jgi:hypothetical protein
MGPFSFTAEIKEDRTLQLPAGTPTGRVTVAITPADEAAPSGRRLLAKLLDLQTAMSAAEGLSQIRSSQHWSASGPPGGEACGSTSIRAC